MPAKSTPARQADRRADSLNRWAEILVATQRLSDDIRAAAADGVIDRSAANSAEASLECALDEVLAGYTFTK